MMPQPVCLHLGPLSIHWYGVMMALAFLAGLINWTILGRRTGRDLNYCSDLLFWIMISGIVGARAAYVVSAFKQFSAAPLSMLRVDQGGLIYYGGFMGAAVALIIFARRRKEPLWALTDFAVTALPLAHAIGRIGCLLNGCCYGRLSSGLLAVRYPPDSGPWWDQVRAGLISSMAPATLSVCPVQLYETAWNLAVYAAVLTAFRRRHAAGFVTAIYLMLYPVGRFLLEPLRGDARMQWHGLSVAQWISVAAFAAGALLLARARRREAAGA